MSELRQNPSTREWVIIARERARRPEDFITETEEEKANAKDRCPFCPGKEKATPEEILAYRSYGTQPNQPGSGGHV